MTLFIQEMKRGFKYAGMFMVVVGAMGMIYGLFGGLFITPMMFAMTLLGIFVVLNFPIALILGVINLFPSLFRRGSKRLQRYFALSLSFTLVFLAFFAVLKFANIEVF